MQISFYDIEGGDWVKLFSHNDVSVCDRLMSELESTTSKLIRFVRINDRQSLEAAREEHKNHDLDQCMFSDECEDKTYHMFYYVVEADDEDPEDNMTYPCYYGCEDEDNGPDYPEIENSDGHLNYLAFDGCGYGSSYLVRINSDGVVTNHYGWDNDIE